MQRVLLAGLVVTSILVAAESDANAATPVWRDWSKRPWAKNLWGRRPSNKAPKIQKSKLAEIMKHPESYIGRTVSFECLFAIEGNLFKPLNTRYNPRDFVNFAVWKTDERLWEKKGRRNILPTIYIAKSDRSTLYFLRDAKRYSKIKVTGIITTSYAGLPWVYATAIRPVEDDKEEEFTDNTLAHIRRGVMMMEQKKYKFAALHFYQAMSAGVPKEHKAFMYESLGWAYFKSGNAHKAYHYLMHATHLNPDSKTAFIKLAKIELAMENGHDAIMSCDRALEISANNPEAHAIMGEAYGQMGKYEQGLEHIELAKNSPGISARELAMTEVRRARVLVEAKQLTDAIQAYANALDDDTLLSEAWLRLEVGAIYETEYDKSKKTEFIDEAINLYDSANTLSQSGDAVGLYKQARAEFKKAVAGDKDFTQVLELLKFSLAANPKYAPAKLLRLRIQKIQGGDPEKLNSSYRRLLRDSGEDIQTVLELGLLLEDMGELKKARDTYEHGLLFAERDRRLLSHYAEVSEKMGDLLSAGKALDRALQITPKDASLLTRAGRVALANGDHEKARDFLQAALEQDPDQVEASDLLARLPKEPVVQDKPARSGHSEHRRGRRHQDYQKVVTGEVAVNENVAAESANANVAEPDADADADADAESESAAVAAVTAVAATDAAIGAELPTEKTAPLSQEPDHADLAASSTNVTADTTDAVVQTREANIQVPTMMEPVLPEELSPLSGPLEADAPKNEVKNAVKSEVKKEDIAEEIEMPSLVEPTAPVSVSVPVPTKEKSPAKKKVAAKKSAENIPEDVVPVDDLPDWAK